MNRAMRSPLSVAALAALVGPGCTDAGATAPEVPEVPLEAADAALAVAAPALLTDGDLPGIALDDVLGRVLPSLSQDGNFRETSDLERALIGLRAALRAGDPMALDGAVREVEGVARRLGPAAGDGILVELDAIRLALPPLRALLPATGNPAAEGAR